MIALRDSIGSDFVETTESFFSANGLLANAKNFEHRPQQQPMAAAVARARAAKRSLHRAGAERARRNFPLGGANARRDAERFVFRAKCEGLGPSLQRGPHLHQEILWAKRPLLLSARPAKIRERADRSYQ